MFESVEKDQMAMHRYIIDVLCRQPIKLFQVGSTSLVNMNKHHVTAPKIYNLEDAGYNPIYTTLKTRGVQSRLHRTSANYPCTKSC